ncbi:MAG: DUF5691 domain-containing protein [Micrococcales bacterium]|nr:DUF5691 domain-containing protein [Micrococcales bacterium]
MTGPTPLDETYPVLRDCWIAGGQAAQVAPAAWQPLLEADADECERRLLALAGQSLEVGLRPDLGPHTVRPVLPLLALPGVPAHVRPTVRRVLKAETAPGGGGSARRTLDLLARRGFTVNPLDWFPSASADLPEVYRPWQEWVADSAPTGPTAGHHPAGTPDDWDHLSGPGRRQLLRRLRDTDRAAARQLLDQHFAGEAAPARLALLEVVAATDLDDADTAFLRSLAGDRSAKVKHLALRLLARAGQVDASADDVAELCAFLTVGRKKVLQVSAPRTKTAAQSRRRDALFETVPLAALATGLEISADDLVTAWSTSRSEHAATQALVTMVVETGTTAQAEILAANLLGHDQPDLARLLRPRMGSDAVRAGLGTVLGQGLAEVHAWCHDDAPEVDLDPGAVLDSAAFAQLCAQESATTAEVHAASTLALLCPPDVAAQAVPRLRAAGVSPQYLDMFVLSAALGPLSEGAR